MLRKILLLALAAGLVRHLMRRGAGRAAAVEPPVMQTWEDEGGSLRPGSGPATANVVH